MILLDTNAVFWIHDKDRRAAPLLKFPRLHLSPVSVLEFQILLEKGRIEFANRATSEHLVHDPRWRYDEPPAGPWISTALGIGWARDICDRLLVAHARLRGWKLATGDESIIEHLAPNEVFPL